MSFVVELGGQMLQVGFETRAVEIALIGCASALGLRDVKVDISGHSIHVQAHAHDGVPLVMFTVVRVLGAYDLHRTEVLDQVIGMVVAQRPTPSVAMQLLRRAGAGRPPWPWWVTMAGGAVLAASITVQGHGTLTAAGLAMVVLVVVNRIGWLVERWRLPQFYVYGAQACVAVALGVLLGRAAVSGGAAVSLVAANLVLLLPVPAIVALAEDAITGFVGVASARAVTVGMVFGGILGGAALAAVLTREVDLVTHGAVFSPLALAPVAAVLAAVVGAVANGFFMNGSLRLVLPAAAAGAIAGTANLAGRHLLQLPGPLAVGIAATVLGAVAVIMAPRFRVPVTAVLITGITGALLPGLDTYRALVMLDVNDPGAYAALMSALTTTATIGVGVVLGVSIVVRNQGLALLGLKRPS
jgi:uncharacterized membrane protein YjjP (DUF1212 family)/uncharacterized membrane protein YjjB (DUF3815 family)